MKDVYPREKAPSCSSLTPGDQCIIWTIAMRGFSGFFGTYTAEKRSTVKNFKRMEKQKKNLNYELKARREAETIL